MIDVDVRDLAAKVTDQSAYIGGGTWRLDPLWLCDKASVAISPFKPRDCTRIFVTSHLRAIDSPRYPFKPFQKSFVASHTPTENMGKGKVCLAYSGGLDTSCILRYLLV